MAGRWVSVRSGQCRPVYGSGQPVAESGPSARSTPTPDVAGATQTRLGGGVAGGGVEWSCNHASRLAWGQSPRPEPGTGIDFRPRTPEIRA